MKAHNQMNLLIDFYSSFEVLGVIVVVTSSFSYIRLNHLNSFEEKTAGVASVFIAVCVQIFDINKNTTFKSLVLFVCNNHF